MTELTKIKASQTDIPDVDKYEIMKGKYFPKVDCVDHGNTSEEGSLAWIIDQASGSDRMIEFGPGAYTLGTDLTVPETCGLRFNKGAVIQIATGKVLTINGSLEAGLYQIFDCVGTGVVNIDPDTNPEIKAHWWGWNASETAINNATYLNSAFNSLQQRNVLNLGTGSFTIDSATIEGFTNESFTIGANDIIIKGQGVENTKITINGTARIGLFYAVNKNNIKIHDIYAYGNSEGDLTWSSQHGNFFFHHNSGTSDNYGITIEHCKLENFYAGGWIMVYNSTSFDTYNVRISNNEMNSISSSNDAGNYGTKTIGAVGIRGASTGYIRDFWIENNLIDAYYMRNGINLMDRCKYGNISGNTVNDAGAWIYSDKGAADVNFTAYAIMLYNTSTQIILRNNIIKNPLDCGFYLLDAYQVVVEGNYIEGQISIYNTNLDKGAIVLVGKQSTISGNTIIDSSIGIVAQSNVPDGQISVTGNSIHATYQTIFIREYPLKVTGNISVSSNTLCGAPLDVYRPGATNWLTNISITNNVFYNKGIRVYKNAYGIVIANNNIVVQSNIGINIVSGSYNVSIVGNVVRGPGSNNSSSYGIYAYELHNPSNISNNIISGFEYGLYGTYTQASLFNNTFFDVVGNVTNSFNDLGRDVPDRGVWTRGQMISNLLPSSGGEAGWLCVTPEIGSGSFSAVSTTGDMTSGEDIITDVASLSGIGIGHYIKLVGAAAGPADLEVMVTSFRLTYGTLSGTPESNEYVVGDTSGAFGRIISDNATDTMYITDCYGEFQAENITCLTSGATAIVSVVDLQVSSNCGTTVNDAVLTNVEPTFKEFGDIN